MQKCLRVQSYLGTTRIHFGMGFFSRLNCSKLGNKKHFILTHSVAKYELNSFEKKKNTTEIDQKCQEHDRTLYLVYIGGIVLHIFVL